ncbi:MAG: DUF58 domain-containing protein [Alloprevotella sp.]|nr:DUF58 domain-containing protein [Alloprevotella sp.]
MDSQELFRRVRHIEIKTKALTQNIFAGEYHSAFKGHGMSFAEVREYIAGDDVRDIDWNVTARTGRPHIKLYEEERELTVMLLIDVSASQQFGTRRQTQQDTAIEAAATLAFSALQNNDKIGAIYFSDRIEKFIPPKKGRKHVLYILREMLDITPTGTDTDLNVGLEYFLRTTKRSSIAFLFSDFLDKHDYSKNLNIAAKKHDLVAVQLSDPFAQQLPDVGLLTLRDAETGTTQLVDTSSPRVRSAHSAWWHQKLQGIDQLLQKCGIDHTLLYTDGDTTQALLRLFKHRS